MQSTGVPSDVQEWTPPRQSTYVKIHRGSKRPAASGILLLLISLSDRNSHDLTCITQLCTSLRRSRKRSYRPDCLRVFAHITLLPVEILGISLSTHCDILWHIVTKWAQLCKNASTPPALLVEPQLSHSLKCSRTRNKWAIEGGRILHGTLVALHDTTRWYCGDLFKRMQDWNYDWESMRNEGKALWIIQQTPTLRVIHSSFHLDTRFSCIKGAA